MRKHYDKEFKAKVALEAVRGEKTIQEIATAYAVHPIFVEIEPISGQVDQLSLICSKTIHTARSLNSGETCFRCP